MGKGKEAYILGIDRLRWNTDGKGITTLVGFRGCPLHCAYCLNDICHSTKPERFRLFTPGQLYEEVRKDDIYFLESGGGITFGGGEPGLQADFIVNYRKICGERWNLTLETCLNFPEENLLKLIPVTDHFIIDIKDMDELRYRSYTRGDIRLMLSNLKVLADMGLQDRCTIRVPEIPEYNNQAGQRRSADKVSRLGFNEIELFTYQTREIKEDSHRLRGILIPHDKVRSLLKDI